MHWIGLSSASRAGAALMVLIYAITGNVASAAAAEAFDHTHAVWTDLLHDHVTWEGDGHHSAVDYCGLKQDPRLDEYLATLSAVTRREFSGWTRAQQLVFLLNTYNAFTVALVAGYYPEIDSIRDIGGWLTPWKYRFVPLFGAKVSLDHIEHDLIRGEDGYHEPRIHFAVNCASVGCPALRTEAYTAERLEEQLQDAETRFLTDRTRNRLDVQRQLLEVSPIFDWYGEDFGAEEPNLERYFAARANLLTDDETGRRLLREGRFRVGFVEHDWSLNDLPGGADCRG